MVTSLQSALIHVHGLGRNDGTYALPACSIKIGIRNLLSLLVCLRKNELHFEFLYPRLEFYVKKLNNLSSHFDYQTVGEVHNEWITMVSIVHKLASRRMNQNSLLLEVDEILSIIDSVVENTAEFLFAVSYEPTVVSTDAFEVLEAFGVQMKFIKSLLHFAIEAGAQMSLLLPHIQPIAINAASVFTLENVDRPSIQRFLYWFHEFEPKCLEVNHMAVDPLVLRAYAQALTTCQHALTLPSDDGHDILKALLDSLISLLWDMLRRLYWAKDEFRVLYKRLRFSRAILKKNGIDEKLRDQITVLICDAGAFIFFFHQTDPSRFQDLLERFSGFQALFEPETIPSQKNAGQVSTGDSNSVEGRDLDITPMSSHQHPHTSLSQVGFKEDELQPLLDRLKHGTKNYLRIVPICGMAGLGKTTLALKLYNHPLVMEHFQARAWCTISQVLDKKKVLIQLLSQILPGDYTRETEEDLANKLRQSLKRRRYLILLDDIWSVDAWDSLKASFPDDSTRSRIILTSRCLDIVPHAQPEEQPYLLRLLSDSECFEILQTKVGHKGSWSTEVTDIVKEIVGKCNGLPLTVTIVAGLLATSEQESWKRILYHLRSGSVSGGAECALELSYRYLPDYLQPCFLYFGAFPEDEEVSVKSLIRLWMAEGFVRKGDQPKRIEDLAREYVDKLIDRSLVMAVKGRSIGGRSSCRIHDTVHDFCRNKAKQENLFHLLQQSHDQLSDFNEPCNLQRLFIHSHTNHFTETRLFCPHAQSLLFFTGVPRVDYSSNAGAFCDLNHLMSLRVSEMDYSLNAGVSNMDYLRSSGPIGILELDYFLTAGKTVKESYFLDMSFIIQIFRTIKVLDIHLIFLMNGIPTDIGRLTQLRYLAIKSFVTVIPSSLGNLSNLETFIAHFCKPLNDRSMVKEVSFPDTLWNLQKLRFVQVTGPPFTLPVENLDNSSSLMELETIDGVCLYSDDGSMEKQFKKFPNIRTLKCIILQRGEEEFHKIVIPELPSQLEVLTMKGGSGVKIEFSSSAKSLLKLKLEGFEMSREDIAVIGKFEVLILSDICYSDNILEMEEEEFIKLRILKLISSRSLEVWTCSYEQNSCLEKLVIRNCKNLREIPTSWLEDCSTLEQIQVFHCSPALESEVRNTEEVLKDYDNKVQVDYKSWNLNDVFDLM